MRTSPQAVQQFTGQIFDVAGNPLDAVRVGSAVGSSGGSGDTGIFTTTGADGRFILNLEMPESKQKHHLRLIITKDGYAGFDSPRVDFSHKASAVIDLGKFTLRRGHSLPVRAVNENGKSLAGAVVEPQGDYAQRRQKIRTDSQGRGVLRNLPAGVVRVYASYGSLARQSTIVVNDKTSDGEETTLRLKELDPQPMAGHKAADLPFPDPPAVGTATPELSVVGWTDGQKRTLGDYRGKVVVLDFWGIWCSACMNGLPAMKEIEAKYAGRSEIVFLGIHSAGTDMPQIQELQRTKEWKLPTGLDAGTDVAEGTTARAYGARGWPTTVIIDREGKIAYNSNLKKWNAFTAAFEMARIAKAMNLPPAKSDASREEQIARINAMNVYQHSELIDRALGQK